MKNLTLTPKTASPVMSMAEAMKKMKAVMNGHAPVPTQEQWPVAKEYFNDSAAMDWHMVQHTTEQIENTVTDKRHDRIEATVRGVVNEEFAAFAKLYVDNGELLRVLANEGAVSIAKLAERLGKDPGNIARTLKKLENYGIVHMEPVGNKVKKPILDGAGVHIYLDYKSGSVLVDSRHGTPVAI